MNDLIDRQAAIDALIDALAWTWSGTWSEKAAIDAIKNLPSVDAVEVKHGRWEYVKKRLARGGYVDASECSVCHKIIFPYVNMNYCPYCGAKMDGERRTDATNRC